MPPEIELLSLCSRCSIDRQERSRIEALLRRRIDWERLLELACWHRVIPLLCRNLNDHAAALVPPGILAELQDRYRRNAQHSLFMTAELLRLLNLLESSHIRAIPYKGPVLAATVYGDLALRQFTDLDILIDRRDAARATELLAAHGYTLFRQWTDVPKKAHPRFILKYHWEYAFISDSGACIELHCPILQEHFPFSFDFEMLWERRRPITIAGTTVFSLCPEDLFLMLWAHGTKHVWARLQWLCDLAELLRGRADLNWQWILPRAHTVWGEPMFAAALRAARNLLGTVLPAGFGQYRKTTLLTRFFAMLIRRQLLQAPENFDPEGPESVLFTLWTIKSLRQRVRYGVRMARWVMRPVPGEAAVARLPALLEAVRSSLRLSRMLLKRSGSLWNDFRQRSVAETMHV